FMSWTTSDPVNLAFPFVLAIIPAVCHDPSPEHTTQPWDTSSNPHAFPQFLHQLPRLLECTLPPPQQP
ncbi:hypothetical protein C0992_013143, partial [Termitomyces sp. T32_za158]